MADKYGVQYSQVILDNEAFKAVPVPVGANFVIFGVPGRPNARVEVYSVALAYEVIPVDGTDPITADLIFHDASAASNTVLLDDYNIKSTNSALVAREPTVIWEGVQSMDPGDSLVLDTTSTSPDTAGQSPLVIVTYRVKEYNSQ